MNESKGKVISDCIEFISQCGREINGLKDALDDMLAKSIANCGIWESVGKSTESSRISDDEWVFTDIAKTFPIQRRRKGRKAPEMHLSYQISLFGDGINFDGNHEPLVHVMLWADPVSVREENYNYAGFPFDDDPEKPRLLNNRLVVWDSGPAWLFSLRLVQLNTTADLASHIVEPVQKLLAASVQPDFLEPEVLKALPEELPALFRYRSLESLF